METRTDAARDLEAHGLKPTGPVHWNLAPAELIEHAVCLGEGALGDRGAFVVRTVPHTGRSPKDKFIVREASTEAHIGWGDVNCALSPEHYQALREDLLAFMNREELFVRDVYAGADPEYQLSVRVITTSAWHNVFVYNMFIEPGRVAREQFEPGFTVLHAPGFTADPGVHGTRSGAFVVLHLAEKTVLIGGTRYAGEVKKAVFSVLNYMLPMRDVLSMHCSANQGDDGDVALFFGLSGTGKTTLSADPKRHLIGDDEHGWSPAGVFNIEGGNYAKAIHLTHESEPLIYDASRRFGAILENVMMDPTTHQVDFDDASITENTRASYPLRFIDGAVRSSRGRHPRNVVLLTADAFGVLPPISRLTPEQAMYHFLSGYTAKVAGTEKGVKEPQATFSACFGEPFLPLPPTRYATMLGQRIADHGVQCWLVNTGWTGGPYGTGHRISLTYTRDMVTAALSGELGDVPMWTDSVFGLHVPEKVPHVPDRVLRPRETWDDGEAYDAQAQKLAAMFRENFRKYEKDVGAEVKAAGP